MFLSWCAPPSPSEFGTSPQFTAQPSDVTAVSGGSAAINCRASGTPQPGIVWYKDDARVVLDSRLTVNRTGALVISSVRAGDAGSYFCVANNTVGSVQSYSARLQIASKWMKPLQWMDALTYWYLWHTILRGRLQTPFSKKNVIVTLGGGGGLASWRFVWQQNVGIYRQHWHRASGESRYNLRSSNELSMSSSSSGITADTRVVASQKQRWSDEHVILLDIGGVTFWRGEGGGGSNLMSQWRYFGKSSLEMPP